MVTFSLFSCVGSDRCKPAVSTGNTSLKPEWNLFRDAQHLHADEAEYNLKNANVVEWNSRAQK